MRERGGVGSREGRKGKEGKGEENHLVRKKELLVC